MDRVDIRPISDVVTLRAVEQLQRQVWRMPDRDVVPSHQLVAATAAGGVVLGAFAEGALIGFCYGFIGLREGRPLLYSHMAGVAEKWRGSGVGFLLKRAQRDAALARGLERIVWTFDPLRSANAHFNLRKLGAEAGRYYVDYYGEMPDRVNCSLTSDRLEADWRLHDARVARAMARESRSPDDLMQASPAAPFLLAASGDPPRPAAPATPPEGDVVRIAIPLEFFRLGRRDRALARAWREATRRAFLDSFARGYVAVDFLRSTPTGSYVLRASGTDGIHAD